MDWKGRISAITSRKTSKEVSDSGETLSENINPQPLLDFTDHIKRKKENYLGRNGNGEKKHFVPPAELTEYWTRPRIGEVCKSYKPALPAKFKAIRENLVNIFSLLVYIGKVQYYEAFLRNSIYDDQLPFKRAPEPLSSPVYEELFRGVLEHQWLFCPLILNYGRLSDLHLEPERVLPFYDEETIKSGTTSRLSKLRVHAACNGLDQTRDGSRERFYVLKQYTVEEEWRTGHNESKALGTLQERGNDHIVRYYGSFTQNNTFNLLLQFVDGGNLLDFFNSKEPPRQPDDIQNFWESLFRIFKGLYCVHKLMLNAGDSSEYRGIHQDIKPDNILLSLQGQDSPYTFAPVLADFGHSDFRVVRADDNDDLGIDRYGNQIYGAPESSHHAEYLHGVPNRITSAADIFSIGCIISDASTWVTFGPHGRDEYEELRVQEAESLTNFENSGHHACFHNAVGRSPAVDRMHDKIRESCAGRDDLTPGVLDLVEKYMLLEIPSERHSANDIYERFLHILKESREQTVPGLTLSPQSAGRTSGMRFPDVSGRARHMFEEVATKLPLGKVGRGLSGSTLGSDGEKLSVEKDTQQGPDITPGVDSSGPSLPPRRPSPGTPPVTNNFEASSSPVKVLVTPTSSSAGEIPPGELSPSRFLPSAPRSSLNVPGEGELHTLTKRISVTSLIDDIHDLQSTDLTLEEAYEWRERYGNYEFPDPRVHKIIKSLQANTMGRDHLFLIDNSRTMGPHRDEVLKAFEALAYISKSESTKIELSFSSSMQEKIYVQTHTTQLVDVLKAGSYDLFGCFMEDNFGWLIDNVIVPRLPEGTTTKTRIPRPFGTRKNPLSVIIFTDGNWAKDDRAALRIRDPVKALIEFLTLRDLDQKHVMLQFVQFGEDKGGEAGQRLRSLVDFGKDQGVDILDTQTIGSSVCSILIGSLDPDHSRL